jgi:hypothetical protein
MPSIEQRLAALELQDKTLPGVLVLFEEATDEQRQAAQAAEQEGVTVLRVVFG